MSPTELRQGQTAKSTPEKAIERTPDLLWISAALMETLVLVGGMLWISNGPSQYGPARILIVVAGAVLGGGVFAALAARRVRNRR